MSFIYVSNITPFESADENIFLNKYINQRKKILFTKDANLSIAYHFQTKPR